jgi:hypothetical protein
MAFFCCARCCSDTGCARRGFNQDGVVSSDVPKRRIFIGDGDSARASFRPIAQGLPVSVGEFVYFPDVLAVGVLHWCGRWVGVDVVYSGHHLGDVPALARVDFPVFDRLPYDLYRSVPSSFSAYGRRGFEDVQAVFVGTWWCCFAFRDWAHGAVLSRRAN